MMSQLIRREFSSDNKKTEMNKTTVQWFSIHQLATVHPSIHQKEKKSPDLFISTIACQGVHTLHFFLLVAAHQVYGN